MRRLLASNTVYATLFFLFVIALAVNSLAGGHMPAFVNGLTFAPDSPDFEHVFSTASEQRIAHGPTLPPDPWNKVAHGPTLPPDPWNKVAHGPTLPPDPWNKVAHGPTLPPDPWNKVAHGPTLPPDPWPAV